MKSNRGAVTNLKGHAANQKETAIKPSHGHAINMPESGTLGGLTSGTCSPIGKGMSAPNISLGIKGPKG